MLGEQRRDGDGFMDRNVIDEGIEDAQRVIEVLSNDPDRNGNLSEAPGERFCGEDQILFQLVMISILQHVLKFLVAITQGYRQEMFSYITEMTLQMILSLCTGVLTHVGHIRFDRCS